MNITSQTSYAVRAFFASGRGSITRNANEGTVVDTCDNLADALSAAERRVAVASRVVVEEHIRRFRADGRTLWCNTPLVTFRRKFDGHDEEYHELDLIEAAL
tara:strand:- start:483 stop:788 length:306 start_codon:yes stop_codon:yes gene_type:complete